MRKHSLVTVALMTAGIHAAFAQTQQVTGTVVDEKNQPYIGATVQIKGTTTGTQTDADGRFSLSVPQGATLVIRALGYNDQEAKVTSNLLVFKLNSNVKALNETVVTALGIRKEKKRIGYTATEVSGETLVGSGEQNVVEALAAKAPGAQVTGSGGTPGASSKILLRGNGSLSGDNQPLFVVDGIPFDNSTSQPSAADNPFNQDLTGVNESNRAIDINPNDIESVTVLRGPAAAALYGSRGGNGAIIITTKKGKYGKKRLGVTFSTSMGWSVVNKLPGLQSKYLQGDSDTLATDVNTSWGPRADTAGLPTYNNPDMFFQTGQEWTNNLGIDGGTENFFYRLGMGTTKNKGVVPNSQFDRYNVNFSGELKLTSWLKSGIVANYVNSNGQRVQNGSNVGGVMLTLLRAPINYNSNYYIDSVTGNQTQYFGRYDNPRFTATRNPYTDVTNRVYGSFYTNIDFTKYLSLNWRLGVDNYNSNSRQIYDLSSRANDASDGTGQVNYNQSYYTQTYMDLILRYARPLSENFDFTGLIGYNIWDTKSGGIFTRGRQLQALNNYNLSNTNNYYASNSQDFLRTDGLYMDATIGYRSRLFATITGRSDWSSAFGRNGRAIFYPKADLSWVFTESMRKISWLSYGKIRAAYADVGNGVSTYTYSKRRFTYYTAPFLTDGSTNGASFPYLGQAGYALSNVNYPGGLVPAHTEGREVGLELRLFKSRVNIEATAYQQITRDNLLQKPVAGSTGFQAEYINAGEVENKGIELALNVDLVKKKDFTWSVGGNWSMNRSKVLSLIPQVSEIALEQGFTGIGSYAIVGQPFGVLYGNVWKRNAAGDLLLGNDGLPIIDGQARRIGNPNPDWLMNLSMSASYKGFYANVLFDIRKGGQIWNGTWARLNQLGRTDMSADRSRNYLVNGVFDAGTAKAGQRNTTDSVSAQQYFQTYLGDFGATENAIQDGGWIRLRSVNIGYRFSPKNKGNWKYFDYLDLSVTGRNLWLHTNYKGVDPETSLTGAGSLLTGFDYFNNPGTKSYYITLKAGF